jgi:hypothetical protein
MRAQLLTSKCCLCGETFKGYGHNTHPVRDDGVVCDAESLGARTGARPEVPVAAGAAVRCAPRLPGARGSVWRNGPLDHE